MAGRDIPLPGMGDERRGYRGPEVATVTGVSYRRLDHWTSRGLVAASIREADGPGSQRRYSAEDVVRVKVVGALRDSGLPLKRITRVLGALDALGEPLRDQTVVTDGDEVRVCGSTDQLMHLVLSGRALTVLALAPLTADIRHRLQGLNGAA